MIDVREEVVNEKIEITLIFDQKDFDFFSLDKGDPKEWIRNACVANNARREKMIRQELAENVIVTDADVEKRIEELKLEKLENENIEG